MDRNTIIAACRQHGAKRVYDAAYARMSGNSAPLAALGLSAANIGAADEIGRIAFGLLSRSERAADLTAVTIAGAKL